MTNVQKIEYLRQYLDLEPEIIRLESEICKWRSRAEKITPSMSLAPGGGKGNRIEDNVEKIVKFQAELENKLTEAVDARRAVEAIICSAEGRREKTLLRYRYIEGMKFEWIAVNMNFDYRWVRRLHTQAISKLTLKSPIIPW